MEIQLARSALGAAKTGWNRYLAAIWLLTLAVFVDLLTGQQFLSDQDNIAVFNLRVPRIAFSFTYSVLIGAFAWWAAGSARTVAEIICAPGEDDHVRALTDTPEYRLWGLSPVNPSLANRVAFWLLSGHGLFLLLGITVVHLGKHNLPSAAIMSAQLYQRIGVFSGAILILVGWLTLRWIFPQWSRVCRRISKAGGD